MNNETFLLYLLFTTVGSIMIHHKNYPIAFINFCWLLVMLLTK